MTESELSQTVVYGLMRELDANFDEIRPLSDSIDPDALDSLFRGSTGEICFYHEGCKVVAEASGEVRVTHLDPQV